MLRLSSEKLVPPNAVELFLIQILREIQSQLPAAPGLVQLSFIELFPFHPAPTFLSFPVVTVRLVAHPQVFPDSP
jgi:hypothetical protein